MIISFNRNLIQIIIVKHNQACHRQKASWKQRLVRLFEMYEHFLSIYGHVIGFGKILLGYQKYFA